MNRLYKLLAVITLLAILLTFLPVITVHADIPTTNLVGYWKLDGNTTATVGPNGTLTGGSWSPSHASTDFANAGSFSLDGTAGHGIQIDPSVTSQTTNISLMAWVNWNGNTGNPQMIVYNGNSGPCGYGILIYYGGRLSILNGGVSILQTATSLPTGSWHHVVATRDTTIWKLYLDGAEVTLPSPWSTPNPPTCAGARTSIGRGTVAFDNTFNGLIDDVRIYNRVVTPTELGVPSITAFTATSPSSTWNIPIPTFAATDDIAVTGYLITTSATPPAVGAAGWTGTVPTSYTVTADGTYTLYPWVKDADGHVSALYDSPAAVVADTTPLVVNFGEFSIPPSNGANLIVGPTQLVVQFSENARHDGSPNAANSLWNYLLVRAGPNGTVDLNTDSTMSICEADHAIPDSEPDGIPDVDDEKIDLSGVTYDPGTFTATITIDPSFAPLANGTYRLFLCGAASIRDLSGARLNGGRNVAIDFTVSPAVIPDPAANTTTAAGRRVPETGFAPNRVTLLPVQTISYADLGSLWLEIPKLGVKMPIVGVPKINGGWNVSWLGPNAGWIEGSAFPSWSGNSVLTGHVWNADNSAGPFRYLNTLWWGDKVIVHLDRQQYVYEVRNVKQVLPASVNAMMKHEELPWLTLVTCKGYDEHTDSYRYRILVRAVLIDVK